MIFFLEKQFNIAQNVLPKLNEIPKYTDMYLYID